MIDRQSAYYYVGLAVLCGAVVLTMLYVVKPSLTVDVTAPDVTHAPSTGKQPDKKGRQPQAQAQAQPQAQAQLAQAEGERLLGQGKTQSLRSPREESSFNEPGELEETAPAPVQEIKPPRLGMIIFGPVARLAFLDQSLVREGARYGAFRVDRIAPKSVFLSHPNGTLELIAPGDRFGPAEVKQKERKRLEKR